MQIRKGQRFVKFGPGQLTEASVICNDGLLEYHLLCINEKQIDSLVKEHPKAYGRPTHIAVIKPGKAAIYPMPDKRGKLRIRYVTLHEA